MSLSIMLMWLPVPRILHFVLIHLVQAGCWRSGAQVLRRQCARACGGPTPMRSLWRPPYLHIMQQRCMHIACTLLMISGGRTRPAWVRGVGICHLFTLSLYYRLGSASALPSARPASWNTEMPEPCTSHCCPQPGLARSGQYLCCLQLHISECERSVCHH